MSESSRSTGFVAVHLGAGYHAERNLKEYRDVCQRACQKATRMIQDGHCAMDVVTAAVAVLEDSPFTNAGTGSNLNLHGNVECDASMMDGRSLLYGAVGALPGIQNPIHVCKAMICEQMKGSLSCGRIPPSFLVGNGALQWARDQGIQAAATGALHTQNALAAYRRHKRRLQDATAAGGGGGESNTAKKPHTDEDEGKMEAVPYPLDTVGAVCVDDVGNVCSAVSSGGISLKHPGRVGQASCYGCGCWAQTGRDGEASVASSTSGCGEHLVRCLLAKACCEAVGEADGCTPLGVERVFTEKFLRSPFLSSVEEKLGGALVLSHHPDEGTELVWAHTTETMCLGYMTVGSNAKFQISRLPTGSAIGKSLKVQGICVRKPS